MPALSSIRTNQENPMKTASTCLALLALAAGPVFAQSHGMDHSTMQKSMPMSPMMAGAPATDGEVRKIDKGAGKITLKHGPIANLGMPPMTMVFRVKDPAMLEKVAVGDKVRFAVEDDAGAYTVTALEAAK